MSGKPNHLHSDVAIVGGGIIGSSIAYFLAANEDFDGSVIVIEKDPTYAGGCTARSVGSIRQQFSTPENVRISRFGFDFISNAATLLQVNDCGPDINLVRSAYLILASADGLTQLQSAYETQRGCGADTELLEESDLSRTFPWLNTDGVVAGCRGIRDEGWFDPYSLLTAFKNKSLSLGVHYVQDLAVTVRQQSNRVTEIQLASGRQVKCGSIVNAAGAESGKFAQSSGIHLPVSPRKRCVFVFRSSDPVEDLPLLADPAGFYVRPEGDCYICGWTPPENAPDPVDESLDVDYEIFEESLWPNLARRIPQFETIRMTRAWAGHYDFNSFDQNGIIGTHPEVPNYLMATGFSGHGLQQAPAVGRALSELLVYGRYISLDLSNLGYERILTNTRYAESAII